MNKQFNRNKGFTLIELVISMALLSIVMLMVVQFMSSTTAANKKTKSNLKAQTEAQEVMQNITDTLVAANYVRLDKGNGKTYEVGNAVDLTGLEREKTENITTALTSDQGTSIVFDFVPDNYGNYVKKSVDPERKVIVDMDTFQLLGEKKDTVYPLSGDTESTGEVRSFRVLKKADTYYYVKPLYLYAEQDAGEDAFGNVQISQTVYRFKYTAGTGTNSWKIYMYRDVVEASVTNRYMLAKSAVDALANADGTEGRLTEYFQDFYVSADAEGNALLIDAVFNVDGYQYNAVETVKFRNSNVLTVRPQNLYKKTGTGLTTP